MLSHRIVVNDPFNSANCPFGPLDGRGGEILDGERKSG